MPESLCIAVARAALTMVHHPLDTFQAVKLRCQAPDSCPQSGHPGCLAVSILVKLAFSLSCRILFLCFLPPCTAVSGRAAPPGARSGHQRGNRCCSVHRVWHDGCDSQAPVRHRPRQEEVSFREGQQHVSTSVSVCVFGRVIKNSTVSTNNTGE